MRLRRPRSSECEGKAFWGLGGGCQQAVLQTGTRSCSAGPLPPSIRLPHVQEGSAARFSLFLVRGVSARTCVPPTPRGRRRWLRTVELVERPPPPISLRPVCVGCVCEGRSVPWALPPPMPPKASRASAWAPLPQRTVASQVHWPSAAGTSLPHPPSLTHRSTALSFALFASSFLFLSSASPLPRPRLCFLSFPAPRNLHGAGCARLQGC